MTRPGQVHVHGAGKVGRAIASSLRKVGWRVQRTSHRGSPSPRITSPIVVLALRDAQLTEVALHWAGQAVVPAGAVVLHTAGARTWEDLAPLRTCGVAVGQMHPLLSFVSPGRSPAWEGATMLIDGDDAAVRAASRVARALGMRPRRLPGLDRTAYHAAAGLVAGGAAALVWAATDLLVGAGADRRVAEQMLAPLLRSVADNVLHVGLPSALSGVVRRGDASTAASHISAARRYAPRQEGWVRAAGLGQVEMAGRLGEASREALIQVMAVLGGQTGVEAAAGKRERRGRVREREDVRKVDRCRQGR